MTENKRILLNVVATYGRSLYGLACGLITARWLLLSLGQCDYGLMGVVGGLVVYVSFFNDLLAGGISRYYAYEVGAAKRGISSSGVEECRKWFSTAVCIHTTIPFILICIGYPSGVWAIRDFLTIPIDRVDDCVWIWRFVTTSCLVSMLSVPFRAMYGAKQEIAELTVYSFATTTLNVFFLYYMTKHPGAWLVRYMLWTCILAIVPQIIICVRAVVKYPECRFRWRYAWSFIRFKELFSYVGGRFACATALILSGQIPNLMVNKFLGPIRNAAISVGHSVSGHCMTLSSAINGAILPAITQAAGAKEYERMRSLMHSTCSLSTLSVLIFAVPLCIESNNVMHIWLVDPPTDSDVVCSLVLVSAVIVRMTDGMWMGILAMSKALRYQYTEAVIVLLTLPLVYFLLSLGLDIVSVVISAIIIACIATIYKVVFAKLYCDFSPKVWLKSVCAPILLVSGMAYLAGKIPSCFMEPTILRVVLTTCITELVIVPFSWFFIIPENGRQIILLRIKSKFGRLSQKRGEDA